MTRMEQNAEQAANIATRLAGGPVLSAQLLRGGRNARVWRIETQGVQLVLKQYPRLAGDMRDRLGAEVAALALMQRAGFTCVPRLVAVDREAGCVLMSWIDGVPVTDVSLSHIDAAAAFLHALHELRGAGDIPHDRLAAEACLSGPEIAKQIATRRDRLRPVARDDATLGAFLAQTFDPACARLLAAARANRAFEAALPQEKRTLAPADFGFHNTLRRPDGTLAFVDFEYFGWDDPVKLTSDLLLHPGTRLQCELHDRLRAACASVYGATDDDFAARLAAFYPLFAARWTLILLNEFLPERWQTRLAAGSCESWPEAKARQLAKARAMLAHVVAENTRGTVHAG
jgi:hypothetical protein